MINCPNPSCKTANPEGAESCQVCQSALPHRYLWGVGSLPANLKPGALFNQRYLLKQGSGAGRIFLDTQPGLLPESLPELPNFLLPYLHLSAYPLHTPRPYAVMRMADKNYVLMLESSAIAVVPGATVAGGGQSSSPAVLPRLAEGWREAPPLRQLSWLWQISQLWDAFYAEGVAATLLSADFLRVDGSVLRLLEVASPPVASVQSPTQTLRPGQSPGDQSIARGQPTLMALARSWQPLVESAHQAVRAFLDRVCERLERQQINAEQLSEHLSQAMSVCSQGQGVTYDLAVFTDQGPTRKRNEDACYPVSGTMQTLTSEHTKTSPQLLIVCDGIGGHQGGDVASKLAIATIESKLQPLLTTDRSDLTATEISLSIEAAICAANDEISAQNDRAQRQARDRMGTTLVLALVKGADVYIAHLGDSRAYRIGEHNCQQVTLDDDVASRQVRLGGSLYREVLLQPGSGSLIQALGMSSSQTLRPTVQRFVMDENCVFLLCSDGLSDSDRVEQFWQSVIRPLVVEVKSTAKVGKQLVELANRNNGHDNVTVGLLTAQVISDSERMVPRDLVSIVGSAVGSAAAGVAASSVASDGGDETGPLNRGANRNNTQLITVPSEQSQTRQVTSSVSTGSDAASLDVAGKPNSGQAVQSAVQSDSARSGNSGKIVALLALLAALGGTLYYLFSSGAGPFSTASDRAETSSDAGGSAPLEGQTGELAPPPVLPLADVTVGSYLRVRQSDFPGIVSGQTGEATDSAALQLRLYPKPSTVGREIPGTIPTGGIAKVIQQQQAEETSWVQLQLCSIPSGDSIDDAPAETDAQGDSAGGSLNVPESPLVDEPMILSPDAEGWAIASSVAAMSENIQDLEPSQQGSCKI